jgi:deferrochelatase/peroxidase EfeB
VSSNADNERDRLDRRSFLTRAGIGAASVAGAGLLGQGAAADAAGGTQATGSSQDALLADAPIVIPSGDKTLAAVEFHGEHQAGITTPKPPAGMFASFNVTSESRGELIELLKTLTETARFAATGGTPPAPTVYAPPADNGTLGTQVPADGLTVTVGFGHTLFDERFGIADQKPARLKPMEPFPNDDLDPTQTGGDVLIQLCAGNPDTNLHAMRQITKATRATRSHSRTESRTRTSATRKSPTGCCGWSTESVSRIGPPVAVTTSSASSSSWSSSGTASRSLSRSR